jgi:hypothetical protein
MHRFRQVLISVAVIAALIIPMGTAGAATSVSYRLTGQASASLFPGVSISGKASAKPGKESGTWSAFIYNDLGGITGGTFTLTSKVRTFEAAINSGTFGPPTGDCARTTIPVRGLVAGGGSFDLTITRIGSVVNGACVVSSSTAVGTATLIYP